MPLAKKETGYPVDAQADASATPDIQANPSAVSRTVQSSGTQPSAKDRSIIRQVAWKIVGPMAQGFASTPEQWFEKAVEWRAKVEKDILEA